MTTAAEICRMLTSEAEAHYYNSGQPRMRRLLAEYVYSLEGCECFSAPYEDQLALIEVYGGCPSCRYYGYGIRQRMAQTLAKTGWVAVSTDREFLLDRWDNVLLRRLLFVMGLLVLSVASILSFQVDLYLGTFVSFVLWFLWLKKPPTHVFDWDFSPKSIREVDYRDMARA